MSKSEKPDIKRDLETSRGMLHYTTYKLLEETKKRPVLWNKKDPNYKKRECLDKGWNDVTRTFVPFFDELDEDEQFTLSEVLRNRYHRCVGQLNTSIKNRNDPKYRPFLYAKQMDFYLKMRGYKLEDLYDEKEIEAIVKTEKPIENDKREGEKEKEKEDEDQIDEIEILLRRELGEDDEEGDDPINENAVSSSKKAKTVELSPATAARSPRLRQKQTILQTSSKEPKPSSTTSKNKEPIRKSLQIKKSHSPDDDFLGYDDDMSSQNNDEEEEDEEEEEEVELVEYHEVEDKMDYIEEEHEMEEVPQQNDFRQQQKQQKPKTTKTKIYSISAALPITTANTITNTFQNESDAADQAFFESIKPAIRRMNDAQKLDFKIDVLQVLRSFQTN